MGNAEERLMALSQCGATFGSEEIAASSARRAERPLIAQVGAVVLGP